MRNLALVVSVLYMIACGGLAPQESTLSGSDAPTAAEMIAQSLANSDYEPSALALQAKSPAKFQTIRRGLTVQQGEIVVMEGDNQLVSDLGDGKYGISMSQAIQNPHRITKRFFETYADEYDGVVVFTTFPDAASANQSVAWHLSVQQDVTGIGTDVIDHSILWGGDNHALHSFINMQYIGKYGSNMGSPNHWAHGVLAHEFAHRWLVHAKYLKDDGTISTALLGRQGSHWATGVQTFGSVMDGHEWKDLGNNNFKIIHKNHRFSNLDQYLMGTKNSDEVPDFFLIRNITHKGNSVPQNIELPVGINVSGTREDITMDQLLAAMGSRKPDYTESQRDFRLAIVLLTAPGESSSSVQQYVDRLETFRVMFEQKVKYMADGQLTVCTQVSSPCDAPGVTLTGHTVEEYEGDGNGLADPGEMVAIHFSVTSTGMGTAPDVVAEMQTPNLTDLSLINPEVELGDIDEGETLDSPEPLLIKIPPFIECGAQVELPLLLRTEGRFFPAQIHFPIGVHTTALDTFEEPDEWTINPINTDTAAKGRWQISQPKGVDAYYYGLDLVIQPSEDHSPEGRNALVTGPEAGHLGDNDVDDGHTTAMSPTYDISDTRDPLLTWYSWHFGYDFNHASGYVTPVENDALVTEVSSDGGTTWVEIDRDVSNTQVWVRKQIRIAEYVPLTDQLRLRFTMADDPVPSLAEAMVDDIHIWDESLVCRPDLVEHEDDPPTTDPNEPNPDDPAPETVVPATGSKGGCTLGNSTTGGGPWALGAFFIIVSLALRRRRAA